VDGSPERGRADDDALPLYIAYDFLPAHRLGAILVELDRIHAGFCHAHDFARHDLTFPDSLRLRVDRVETGNSVQLTLTPGIQQVVEFVGSNPVAVGGVPALVATGMLVVSFFSRMRREIQQTRLGNLAIRDERARVRAREIALQRAVEGVELARVVEHAAITARVARTWYGHGDPEEMMRLAEQLEKPLANLDREFNAESVWRVVMGREELVERERPADPPSSQSPA
jgi:hypothetical protein